jgi:hypothetical protein
MKTTLAQKEVWRGVGRAISLSFTAFCLRLVATHESAFRALCVPAFLPRQVANA